MTRVINVAIIGLGRIAQHHINEITNNKNYKLVSVSDLDSRKLEEIKKKYQVEGYRNFDEMLSNHNNIDLVSIMTPSGMHYEHAKKIIIKFKKNVVLEKPTCLKIKHLKHLYFLAKKNKSRIFPVFQNRYNLSVQRVKKSIISGEIGKIRIVSVTVRWCRPQRYYDLSKWRGTFSHDGGALTNQGIHHIDLIRYLGGEIKNISCKMSTLGAKIEVEDTVVGHYEFKNNNAVGSLEITTSARPIDYEATISVIGSKGIAKISGIAANKLDFFSLNQSECKKNSEFFNNVYGNGHKKFYVDLEKSINKNKKFPVSENDCVNTIKFLHAFYLSNYKSKKVSISQVKDFHRLGEKNEKISKLYRFKK